MLLSTLRGWALLVLVLIGWRPARAQQVSAGGYHNLSIHADGTLWAWGYNTQGQLGTGNLANQTTPQPIGAATWQSVSGGQLCSLAIRQDGTLWAWGSNDYGQLGTSGTSQQNAPTQVGTDTNWRSVSVGYYHVLALKTDGTLWAWGSNTQGQLGTGSTSYTPQATPVQVGAATTWQSVSAGEYHSLAIQQDGTLWSWGNDTYGQLGQGGLFMQTGLSTPRQVGTDTNWRRVAAGAAHSLALKTTGTLWGWGNNTSGQVGTGLVSSSPSVPTQVGTAATWGSISGGRYHSAAIRQDGTLWTWGDNYYGQLGDGTTTAQAAPQQVGALATWQSASAGNSHTVALRTDNTCWAWGGNFLSQLGTGGGLQLTPVQLLPPTTWREVAAGTSYTVAIRTDGTLWAWGYNADGELGLGNTTNQTAPQQVGTATTWQSVSAADYHTMAIRTDGTLWAWGFNGNGRLGLGNTTNQLTPTQVGTATNWQQVSAGSGHTLAVRTDGTLWAWGNNGLGVLGTGTSNTNYPSPLQVGTATNWVGVSTNIYHTLAVRADGSLWAWGYNYYGQLGTGNTTNSNVPVQVGTGAQWQSAAAGDYHSLAVRQDGTLWAWGYNGNGELGLGTTTNQVAPQPVGTATWLRVGAGSGYSGAIRADGSLWAWGANLLGQLGVGSTASQSSPVAVAPGWQWQRVALSNRAHTAAIRQDGTLWIWGYNDNGQLAQPYANPQPSYVANGGAPLAAATPLPWADWVLAPNPAHGQTQLLQLPAGPLHVQVLDAQGRLVRTGPTATLSLAGLVPGLYLVRVACAGQPTRTLRLVVD